MIKTDSKLHHTGALEVALTYTADHISQIPGLKLLAAALEDGYVDVKHLFDEAAGELKVVLNISTEEHDAHVAAAAEKAAQAKEASDREASIKAQQAEREQAIAERLAADAKAADEKKAIEPPAPSQPSVPSAADLDQVAGEEKAKEATSSHPLAEADEAEPPKPPSIN